MRSVIQRVMLCGLLAGCTQPSESAPAAEQGTTNAPPVPNAAPAQPPQAIAAPPPRIGGAVLVSGEFAVELVANASGTVEALVQTSAGEPVANADVSGLAVTVQGQGQTRHDVALAWDAPRALFRGAAQASARFASGPIDVAASIRGKPFKAHLDVGVVVPRPEFGGRMLAVGNYSAEVVPKVGGAIDVHLRNAAGAAITADAGIDLSLKVKAKDGSLHAVALGWNAARACFEGRLQGGAELAAGPLELTATIGQIKALGRVELAALIAPPSIGGTIVAVGDYSVEIAPQLDGHIDAVVRNAAGASVEGGVQLTARVQAGGELRPVALQWDAALGRFRGKLEGNFKLVPGPIELALVAEGGLRTGATMTAAVLPAIAVDARADLKAGLGLDAKAKARADLAARLKAEADAAAKARAAAQARLKPVSGAASGSAKLSLKVPQPKVRVSTGASADAKASGSAKAKSSAEGGAQQGGGVKLGGSLKTGFGLGQ